MPGLKNKALFLSYFTLNLYTVLNKLLKTFYFVFSPPFFCPSTEGLVLPPDQLKGQLEFCNVSFTYPTRKEAPIFQNLNLLVPAGTIMAVVGPSGSGKSTLVSLLLRLYDTDAGETLNVLLGFF